MPQILLLLLIVFAALACTMGLSELLVRRRSTRGNHGRGPVTD